MGVLTELALSAIPDPEDDDKVLVLKLREHAYNALLCSQGPTYQDYLAMSWPERDAFSHAYKAFRGLASQRAGLAVHGPLGSALAGAEADGGEAAERVFLEQVTQAALAVISAERVS